MAFEIPLLDITLLSSGSTGDQYKAVVASSSANAGGFAVVATRGARFTGWLQDNSTEAAGRAVRLSGVSKVAAGDSSAMDTAITEGSLLTVSSVGQAVPATSGSRLYIGGIALEGLTTGSTGIIAATVFPPYVLSSAATL